ncbi:hypothetical protein Rs2_22196 [Raphanus sativus]|nr:hypothetical protein Rs2_22196 [Raphanus sativus]
MAEDFARAVDHGLKLAKQIYFRQDRAVAAPRPMAPMERSPTVQAYLPSAPMVYAVIPDPGIVDNPDLPSYQPHGRWKFTLAMMLAFQEEFTVLETKSQLSPGSFPSFQLLIKHKHLKQLYGKL